MSWQRPAVLILGDAHKTGANEVMLEGYVERTQQCSVIVLFRKFFLHGFLLERVKLWSLTNMVFACTDSVQVFPVKIALEVNSTRNG